MTDVAELASISAAIHDEYFDLDRLVHDADRSELRLTIYPGRYRRVWLVETYRPPVDPLPTPLGELVVRNVVAVTINDDAGIGWFDVGGLAFAPNTSELRLWSSVPLEIRVHVQALDVELVRS